MSQTSGQGELNTAEFPVNVMVARDELQHLERAVDDDFEYFKQQFTRGRRSSFSDQKDKSQDADNFLPPDGGDSRRIEELDISTRLSNASILSDSKLFADTDHLQSTRSLSGIDSGEMSPGRYFGARSMPLESLDDLWNQQAPSLAGGSVLSENSQLLSAAKSSAHHDSKASMGSGAYTFSDIQKSGQAYQSRKSHTTDPLCDYFKALPTSLRHHHFLDTRLHSAAIIAHQTSHFSDTPISIALQEHTAASKQHTSGKVNDEQISDICQCTVKPRTIALRHEVSTQFVRSRDAKLILQNEESTLTRTFSIYSSGGKLRFNPREGRLGAGETIAVTVQARKSAVMTYLRSKDSLPSPFDESMVVLFDDKFCRRVQVTIEVVEEETDDNGSISDEAPSSPLPPLSNGVVEQHVNHGLNKLEQHQGTFSAPLRPKCRFCAMDEGFV